MKYALHDTEINSIVCNNAGIEFYFAKGVYLLNEQGKEGERSYPCRMVITINEFSSCRMYEHITVMKHRKSKITDIAFEDFLKLLKEDSFDVDIDYYSFFGASILLKGYCGKFGIEFTITEVDKVEYVFDKE